MPDRPEARNVLPAIPELADIFQKLADYISLDGQSPYRIIAYEKAAALFRVHPVSVSEMALRGELRDLPGIGPAMEGKVLEYVTTGRLGLLDEMSERYPEGLLTLMRLPGVGPKTAHRLWQLAHISDVHMLEQAAREGRIRGLPGMGAKTEQNFLRAIEAWKARAVESARPRRLIAEVEPQAARFIDILRALPATAAADYAGSLRRRLSLVRDIDLVVGSSDPCSIMDSVASLPELHSVEERGDTKLSAVTQTGLGLDLRVVEPESYGDLLQHFTGSAAHNVALRAYAQRRGFKISEYGIEHVESGRLARCATEAEVYGTLDLAYIEPELRENEGELEAASTGGLPDLIDLSDLKGDLHVHSDWSDGRASMEEMAHGARTGRVGIHLLLRPFAFSLGARRDLSRTPEGPDRSHPGARPTDRRHPHPGRERGRHPRGRPARLAG